MTVSSEAALAHGLLTDSELAEVLRVSRSTVSRLAREGSGAVLVPVYVLGARRWRRTDVEALVRGD